MINEANQDSSARNLGFNNPVETGRPHETGTKRRYYAPDRDGKKAESFRVLGRIGGRGRLERDDARIGFVTNP